MRKNKNNILITCAGGSSSIYLARLLAKRGNNIFLADGSAENVAPYLGFPFAKIPFGNDRKFKSEFSKLIKEWKINCVVPGADEELIPLRELSEKNKGIIIVSPQKEFIKLCLDKRRLMGALKKFNISAIPTYRSIKRVEYPAIAKPNIGRGSREVHRLNNQRNLEGYLSLYGRRFNEILVQKFIKGDEYTVSVIVNNLNKIIGIVPKRVILKKGITRAAVTDKQSKIEEICQKVVEVFKPAGPFNVQLILSDNRPYIFEINPRLSTTSVLTDKAFGNEVELFNAYYNSKIIKNSPRIKTPVFLYRYEENYFKT